MKALAMALVSAALGSAPGVRAQSAPSHDHDHAAHAATAKAASAPLRDTRQAVRYPRVLREHTLVNMRDHLLTLARIQAALSEAAFDRASDLAEQRLGMSSLALHGAHEVARYMPKGMQEAGTAMHRAASRFALAAKDASATGELRPTLGALAALTQTCVACHAGYRLE